MADRRYHVASPLIGVVVWTGENDTKTIGLDADLCENGAKQVRFRSKTDKCGRGLNGYQYRIYWLDFCSSSIIRNW